MKQIGIITLFVFIGYFSFGQEVNTFTIEEAKAYGLDKNLSIAQAENAIEIARLQIVETRGMGLPQVEFNGSFNHFINLPVQVMDAKFLNPMAPEGSTVSFEAGTEYSSSGTLQASQLIFNGSYIIGLKAASFFANFQESASKQTKEDIAFNVIQSYQLAAVAKSNLTFVDSLIESTEQLIEKQRNYLELGLMVQEDMDQLNYSLLTVKSVQSTAEIQYENALALLKLAMGYPMKDPIEISDSPDALLSKSSLSSDGDFHNNLTYEILQKQVRLSEFNVKNNQFANLPTLSAFFQHTYNAYRNEFNFFADERWYPQTLWGLQLNIPIFSGLTRHARTSQAKIKLKNDKNALEQLEQSLQFQELQYRNNLRGAENKFELQIENVKLAKSIYDNTVIQENIGKGNSLIVTQKHNQLLQAQSQYIGSMVELFQARLSIDKLYNNIIPSKQ